MARQIEGDSDWLRFTGAVADVRYFRFKLTARQIKRYGEPDRK